MPTRKSAAAAIAAMMLFAAHGGAKAQSAQTGAPVGQALVMIESADPDTSSTETLLTALSRLEQADAGIGTDAEEAEAQAMVTVPTDTLTEKFKSLLRQNRVELQADPAQSKTHLVFKGLGFTALTQKIAQLRAAQGALVSQDLRLSPTRNETQQITISPKLGIVAVLFPPGKGPGEGSLQGMLQGSDACKRAAEKLPYVQDLSELINGPPKLQSTINAVAFRNACLSPIAGEGAPGPLPDFVRAADPLRIMGLLEHSPGGASPDETFCSAFLIDAYRIATARHCFYRADFAGSVNVRHSGIEGGTVHFRRLSPPYERLRLKAEILPAAPFDVLAGGDPNRPIRAQADIVIVGLESPVADVPAIRWAESVDWRHEAWTAGPVDMYAAAADPGIPATVKAVRWPSGIECSLLPQAEGCYAHVCQAVGSFSGAPIMVKGASPEEIVIGGMHLGPYSTASKSCPVFKQKVDAGMRDVGYGLNVALAASVIQARMKSTAITTTSGDDDHERKMAGVLPGIER